MTVGVNGISTTTANLVGSINPNSSSNTPYGPQNLVPNPSFEQDAPGGAPAGWASSGSAVFAVQTGWSQVGTNALRVTSTALAPAAQQAPQAIGGGPGKGIPISGNQQYTFSGWMNRVSSGGTSLSYLQVNWLDAGGTLISASTSTGGGSLPPTAFGNGGTTGIFRDFLTCTAPSNAFYAGVFLVQNGGASGGTADAYFDALMFNMGALLPYFDGDATGFTWLGTSGNSPSQQTGTWFWFSYGTSLPLPSGTTTPPIFIGNGTTTLTETFKLTGLTSGTNYYIAAVAQNAGGTVYGKTISFVAQVPNAVVENPIVTFGQPSVTIPHFNVPFKIVPSLANPSVLIGAQVVEQDTLEEVVASVRTVVLCPIGACQLLPTFGRADLLFAQEPLATNELVNSIQQWEPRASESVVSELKSDDITWKVTLDTSTTGAQNL